MTTSTLTVETRSKVRGLLTEIGQRANEALTKLTNGSDAVEPVNELVKDSLRLAFHLGGLSALSVVEGTSVPTQSSTNRRHNVHDPVNGRFVRASRS